MEQTEATSSGYKVCKKYILSKLVMKMKQHIIKLELPARKCLISSDKCATT